MVDAAQAARRARYTALALVALLLVLDAVVVAGVASIAPTPLLVVLGAFLALPLLVTVPGLVAGRRRAYVWATLCLTPQFLYSATEMVASSSQRGLAIGVGLAAIALLLALMTYVKTTRGLAGA